MVIARSARALPLAALLILVILLQGAAGLFALWRNQAEQARSRGELAAISALLDAAKTAQTAFHVQIQEWKNILLRGQDPGLRSRHEAAFRIQSEEVARSLATLGARADAARARHAAINQRYAAVLADAQLATGDGARRLAIAGPEGPFTRQLAAGLRQAALEFGLPAPLQHIYPTGTPASAIARDIVERAAAQGGVDALLIAETGIRVREVAASLAAAGLGSPPLRLMGPALWLQDVALAADPILAGAVFPGPDPSARGAFESRYQQSFGDRPARIAAIAHDATLLGLRGLRGAGAAELPIGQTVIGADGSLRLMPGGEVQRGLAILAVEPGGEPRLVEPAPPPGAPGS